MCGLYQQLLKHIRHQLSLSRGPRLLCHPRTLHGPHPAVRFLMHTSPVVAVQQSEAEPMPMPQLAHACVHSRVGSQDSVVSVTVAVIAAQVLADLRTLGPALDRGVLL